MATYFTFLSVIIQIILDLLHVTFNQKVHISEDVEQNSKLSWQSYQNQAYNYF